MILLAAIKKKSRRGHYADAVSLSCLDIKDFYQLLDHLGGGV